MHNKSKQNISHSIFILYKKKILHWKPFYIFDPYTVPDTLVETKLQITEMIIIKIINRVLTLEN